MKMYEAIARAADARTRCLVTGNQEWRDIWTEKLRAMQKELPSGSGIDNGTKIIMDECDITRIVLICDYHHMNQDGFYDGWTHHRIVAKPTFMGIDVRVATGPNKNDIKEYLANVYGDALDTEYDDPTRPAELAEVTS